MNCSLMKFLITKNNAFQEYIPTPGFNAWSSCVYQSTAFLPLILVPHPIIFHWGAPIHEGSLPPSLSGTQIQLHMQTRVNDFYWSPEN